MDLSNYSLWLVFVISLVVVFAAAEGGRWLGHLISARGKENISPLAGAIVGLLALMISFTFAMALSRYEARREAVVAEATSIGAAALRARLLPAPHNTECFKLLQDYVQIRLDVTRRVPSASEMTAAVARSNAIQEALWREVKAVAAKDNALVPTGLFVYALNEMIDNQRRRIAAALNRVPNVVVLTLYGMAIVSSAFIGYAAGLNGQRLRLPVYVVGMLACTLIFMIQDLDRPSAGFINVSQQPLFDTAASIAAFPD